jgi:hypothetical protein
MPQRNTSDVWTGPSTREMIDTHTLAREVINRHNDPCPVFDDFEILKLRRFVQDPTQRLQLLAEFDMDEDSALQAGSLTGYIIATWGTDKSVLTEDEVTALKDWFDNGGGKTDDELAEDRFE